MAKKKYSFSLSVVCLALLIGVLVGMMFTRQFSSRKMASSQLAERVSTVMQLVDQCYVDRIDPDSASDKMLNAMLSTLDPHSCYLSPKAFEQEAEMVQGHFEGIGVVLYYLNDTVYASNVQAGSPAERAGVHPGDRIIMVDTTQVSGRGLTKEPQGVVNLIRGPRLSMVDLGVQRQGSKQLKHIKVQRNVINHSSVPAAVMLDNQTGYIYVSHFAGTTALEFHTALQHLTDAGMKHLVLDLRNNGGGVLEGAIMMANELLPKGKLIVYTQGAHERRHNVYATGGGLFDEGRLTVLINERSASASEVVSGAIQDNDRGTIVGHRSFGKGLVQHQFDLPGGAAMLLTIARYYSPSGRCIQRPYDKGSDEYYTEYLSRILSDYSAADSLLSHPDTSEAFRTVNGRTVYGGGGIQPDVVLPYFRDTHLVYFNEILGKQVMETIIYHKLNREYEQLMKQYPTLSDFERRYRPGNELLQQILAQADKQGLKRDEACIAKYGSEMVTHYRAILARTLYGEHAYYKIIMPTDVELQHAIKAKVKLTQ